MPTAPIRGCNPTVPALLLATSSLRRGRPRTTSQGPKLRSVRPRATPRSVHEACAGRPSPGLACDGRPVFESFDRCRGSRLVPRTTRSVRGRGFGQSMDQDRALSDPTNLVGSQRISLDLNESRWIRSKHGPGDPARHCAHSGDAPDGCPRPFPKPASISARRPAQRLGRAAPGMRAVRPGPELPVRVRTTRTNDSDGWIRSGPGPCAAAGRALPQSSGWPWPCGQAHDAAAPQGRKAPARPASGRRIRLGGPFPTEKQPWLPSPASLPWVRSPGNGPHRPNGATRTTISSALCSCRCP